MGEGERRCGERRSGGPEVGEGEVKKTNGVQTLV